MPGSQRALLQTRTCLLTFCAQPRLLHSVHNPAHAQVSNMVTELSPELRATATNDARRGAVADASSTATILAEVSKERFEG